MPIPLSSKSHCIFRAHSFFSFLSSTMRSLILIGVSRGLVFGLLDLFSNPSMPYSLKAASQYFNDLSEKGQTLAISLIDISLSRMGFINLNFSSFVDLGIVFICPQTIRKAQYVCIHYRQLLT